MVWGAFLLVTSMALIALSAYPGRRGPGLVGAGGLIAFVLFVGAQLRDAVVETADGALAGWPRALAILGPVAIAAGSALARRPGRT